MRHRLRCRVARALGDARGDGGLGGGDLSYLTELFHGGLRYLEYFEFCLVREALIERETLLEAMPHISWPMRFGLPYHRDMRFEAAPPA